MSQSDYTLTVAELPALRQFFQLQNLLGVGSPDFTDKSILQLMTQLDALSASYPQLSNAKFKGWTDHRAITSSGVEKAGDLINQDEQASQDVTIVASALEEWVCRTTVSTMHGDPSMSTFPRRRVFAISATTRSGIC
jgi:hypothetical protein